jgi:hypothetical protein
MGAVAVGDGVAERNHGAVRRPAAAWCRPDWTLGLRTCEPAALTRTTGRTKWLPKPSSDQLRLSLPGIGRCGAGVYRPQIGFGYAAWEYSQMSPLRIVRRCTRALARSVTGGGVVSTVGGGCRRAW